MFSFRLRFSGRIVLADFIDDAGLTDDFRTYFISILYGHICHKLLDQRTKILQFGMCAFIDGKPVRNGFTECGPEADIVIGGGSNNLAHRGIADAACRIIDNPLERLFVIGVDHQTEVGYDIFDLLALIEERPP